MDKLEDIQEAFTRRMLNRVSLRKSAQRDGNLDASSTEDLQRRQNILKAIDDSLSHRESPPGTCNDETIERASPSYVNNFQYFASPLYPNNTVIQKFSNKNNKNNYKENSLNSYNNLSDSPRKSTSHPSKGFVSSYAKYLESGINSSPWRVESSTPKNNYYKNPQQMTNSNQADSWRAQLANVENISTELHESLDNNISQRTESLPPTDFDAVIAEINNKINELEINREDTYLNDSSVTTAINKIDEQIKDLKINESKTFFTTQAVIERASKIYPILDEIHFDPTGYTPKKSNFCPHNDTIEMEIFSTTDNTDEDDDVDSVEVELRRGSTYSKDSLEEIIMYEETPKMTRKMPLMESTRKSVHSDSTNIKFPKLSKMESTISPIAMALESENQHLMSNNRQNIVKNQPTGNTFDNSVNNTFEVERFLQEALGDELYNTTETCAPSEDAEDKTNSHFNASELMSHDCTPLRKRVLQVLGQSMNETAPANSSTLNRSLGLYRSFSQRIKKKFRPHLKSEEEEPAMPIRPFGAKEAEKIHHLLRQVSMQQTLMSQATKALNLCQTIKEFTESPERIESERSLLLANIRRKRALEEIRRLTSNPNANNNTFLGEKGEVTIKEMQLNLRSCVRREFQDGESVEWFVIVVTQGITVWATQAVVCPINSAKINFPETITIPNLTPDFKILLEIYSMKLKKATYNHEEKYRISRHRRSASCPIPKILTSPSKLLKLERPLSPTISDIQTSTGSSFQESGYTEFFLHDLSLSSPWPLMLVPLNSILHGTIDLSIACRLHLSVTHEGFITHGDEAGGYARWNRRWCVLKGHTLMFWNYPREQEVKEPLMTIKLINCVSKKITTADRTICARPRTLLLEIMRNKNEEDKNNMVIEYQTPGTKIVRHFLFCDTLPDLMEWTAKLNHVIFALREWNVIDSKSQAQPQISAL